MAPRLLRSSLQMAQNNPGGLIIAAVLLLASTPAAGSVARAVEFDKKVEQADSIILGKVTSTRSSWDPSGKFILTYSTFQVEKAFKGAPVPEVTLVTPGGQVGSVRQETAGVPTFVRGDQHVLFVKQGTAGPTVMYFDQGAYKVSKEGRELKVAPVATNLVLIDSQTGKVSGQEPVRSLGQFEGEVRASVSRAFERDVRASMARTRDAAKPAERAPQSAFDQAKDFLFRNKILLTLLAAAIALTSYFLVKKH